MLNYNTITNPGPNLTYNKYLLIPQIQNKNIYNTPQPIRNSVPNLNGVNSFSNSQNVNNNPLNSYSPDRNYWNGNQQNNYQNYNQGQYNFGGYNSPNKERFLTAGNNIMK